MELTYNEQLMGKWHHDVQITETIKTSDLTQPYFIGSESGFSSQKYISAPLTRIFGDTIKDKTVLDVACNAGGHLFECQKLGIKRGFGFDVRDLWINQANWLKQNINLYNTDNLTFQVADFKILDTLQPFDITFFNGIFYHLAFPFADLAKVANLTTDVITINTAYDPSVQSDKPCLVFNTESKELEHGLTGIEGVSWKPNDDRVLIYMLKALGFKHFKVLFKSAERKRLCVMASKLTPLAQP